MENKHTPGPWIHNGTTVIAGADTFRALFDCKPLSMTRSGKECEANARLIAAAPTMLKILELLEIQLSYQHAPDPKMQVVMCNSARHAISTAKDVLPHSVMKETDSWNYHQHGQHAYFPKEDWRDDVADDNTILGYQKWVEHNLESLLHDTELDGVDAIEVAGCTEADGIVEVIGEKDAEFFSVYAHKLNEGVECVCDFNTKGQAVEFATGLASRTGISLYGNLCSID